ncbi:ABC transporter ATP-binding protein [Pedobacter boryungensis]|uniref:ATP-binding cassette domain-containing protein n=1 Tax=Pedobacter boryungensis TaxID=869962 RepID=A0ABX2DAG0_9SPHI|nr:polysaccharide ABC transporter ATP-binding protein [Pedobacter boryungensis]NQX30184.1 ATP-binding cassette domain-containing protein [Pedobacter boryungensis]
MSLAIKVENLSKAYQLGQIGTGTISRDLERWYARIRKKEDPFLRIGEDNNQNAKSTSDVVWSLRDINFKIEQGDAVGIIGRNGAGKSTLLKILSKITSPTTGKITGHGRIASLLEVGTGFHPELSGRENIFLNGAILGMRKKEIARKLDEIVDFAGIQRYLDTPVKRYSSGMYVRLAFAVAAHLESEILIVDEVLAVGDAEFQKKCLGKMSEVSKGEGRTVLFVSHNMDAVMNLCKSGIVLNSGKSDFVGNVHDCIDYYQNSGLNSIDNWVAKKDLHHPHFSNIKYEISGEQPNLILTIHFKTNSASNSPGAFVVFGIKSSLGGTIMEAVPSLNPFVKFNGEETSYSCEVELTGFIPGTYFIYAWLGASEAESYDWQDNILSFEITQAPMAERTFPYSARTGFLVAQSKLI